MINWWLFTTLIKLKFALLGMSQLWLDKDMSCEKLQLSNSAFQQDDPDQDGWSKITWIIAHQRSQQIHPRKGFIGSFYAPRTEWSWIIDSNLDHLKGTHLNSFNRVNKTHKWTLDANIIWDCVPLFDFWVEICQNTGATEHPVSLGDSQ